MALSLMLLEQGFLAVYHRTKFRKRHAFGLILVAWLIAPVMNLSRFIPTTTITAEGVCIQNQIWPNGFWHTFTHVVVYLVGFLIPVLIILSLYLSIFIFLKRRAESGSLSGGENSQLKTMNKAKVNVLITLFLVTGLFFLCWVWNMTFFFLVSIKINLSMTSPFYNFTVFMMSINCCVNPFCYAVQYKDFQNQVKLLFCRCKQQTDNSLASVSTSVSSM